MRTRPLVAVAMVALLAPVSAPWASEADCAVILQGSGADWREARALIESFGGEIHHVLPPDAMVGRIPDVAWDALRRTPRDAGGARAWDPDALLLVRTSAESRAVLSRGGLSSRELSPESRAALEFLLPRPPLPPERDRTLRLNDDGTVGVLPPEAWETPALLPEDAFPGYARPEGIGNTWYHTGEYLAGDVAVTICRPESNGSASGDGINTENWTAGEVSYTLGELMAAMAKLQSDAPRGNLTFVYREEHAGGGVMGTVDCDYEAVKYGNFDSTVVLNVLGKLGYTQPTAWERMHEWVNGARTAWATDWAVGFFIVDNSAAGTGRASAYINGPTVWIFGGDTFKVYHHESGHSWGAWDEYATALQSPTSLGGYTQDVDANSAFKDGTGFFSGAGEGLSALMLDNIDYASPWTRGQVGIWDLDGDGVYEPLDVRPGVNIGIPSGPSWGPLQFAGVAWGGSLKVESGALASSDVTIGRISKVEWRMNGGPWQPANPQDGAFDSSWEQYIFVTPPLRNWGFVFEVRATDDYGNTTAEYARYDYSATGSPLANQGADAGASVSPPRGSTATTFFFDASASRDLEDGTSGLQYQWDFEGDLIWDTPLSPSPTATHTYPIPGIYFAQVAVLDRMGHGAGRPLLVQVAASDIPPFATFIADKGLAFASSPVPFTFDASGVWDGEDPTASLQVRWDFEGDGVWDTAWSTAKTVFHDYSIAYAVNPGQESGNTYLYSGCSVNGYAQSFTAATTSIGKAELYLSTNGTCATPGGTITVGLRSSLTGAWLTSLTVNQSVLNLGDWNLFDFPDATGLTVGNTYDLVALTSDQDLFWLADGTNPYAGGQHYYSFNGGSSWSTNTNYDHTFRIYDGALSTVPLTKSKAWRVRLEVMDSSGQTAQYVNHVAACGYDNPPSLGLSVVPPSGNTNTNFGFTATGSDPDYGTSWDGMLDYRWDVDGDGTYETEFSPTNACGHKYPRAGIYQATCEVRDRYHATARATLPLSVAPIAGGMGLTDRNGSVPPGNTDEREVDASLLVNGEPREMMLSENPSFTGVGWVPFSPLIVCELSAGAGSKTLYAKFRSGAGNESGSVWATILYAPVNPLLTVTPSGGDVRLSWGATGAFDYSVYYGSHPDFATYPPTQFTTSPTTGTTLDHLGALADGQTWYYAVETDPLP